MEVKYTKKLTVPISANKIITNIVNNKNIRKTATALTTGAALMPVVILEGSVLTGRTYQAYKRGGALEAKERATEESVSSIGWLWGIPALNKGTDFLINKVFKVKNFQFDMGKDNIRYPMQDAIGHLPQNQKNKLMGLKLGKILASSFATVYFMGMVLPKIVQNQTQKRIDKAKQNPQTLPAQNRLPKTDSQMFKAHRPQSMEEFLNETKQNSNSNVSFKGFDSIANTILYNMENNHIVNLLTVDAGLFAGRVYNAPNKYEKIERIFRDLSSSFFYVGSTPLIVALLNKIDPLKGKNSKLDPTTVDSLTNLIKNPVNKKVLDWRNMDEIPLEEFQRGLFGTYLADEQLVKQAANLEQNGIITLKQLSQFIDDNITDKTTAKALKENAEKLAKLQPQKAKESILTPSQIKSVFKNGLLNDGDTINSLINTATGGRALNHTKFISQKKVDATRKQIFDYCESIIEQAKKENLKNITPDFLQKMKNRNFLTKVGFWGIGMVISAAFLSTIIPKTQYFITEKLTGKKGFVRLIEEPDNDKSNQKLSTNA
ncbi:MAG TPA: hypothetical protein H9673_01800 [Candidatus Adamsella sp.]|nr:hypothetical protein [Candidatus Adamsella sp.]